MADFLQDIGQIKDEKEKLEKLETEIKHQADLAKNDDSRETTEPKESAPSVVVNIEKGSGFKVKRDENGDMDEIIPTETAQ